MKGTSFFKIRKMVALQALQAARMAMTGAGAVFCLYSAAAGAPSISPVYPKDTVVWEASPACLVVRVTAGTGPFTYSWYKGSTPDLAVLLDTTNTPCRGPITKDSLSDTLMFSGYLFESGYYVCVVRNLPSDSVISRIAHFIVQKLGPVIIVQPKDTSVLEDDPVSFTIVATGYTPSFNYKWNYWDSNSISFSYTIFFGPVNTFTFPNENHPLGAQLPYQPHPQ